MFLNRGANTGIEKAGTTVTALAVVDRMAVEAAPRDFRFICLLEDGDMELFLGFVGIMVILALIRLWNGPKDSKGQMMGSNEHMHYWIPPDPGTWDGGRRNRFR